MLFQWGLYWHTGCCSRRSYTDIVAAVIVEMRLARSEKKTPLVNIEPKMGLDGKAMWGVRSGTKLIIRSLSVQSTNPGFLGKNGPEKELSRGRLFKACWGSDVLL
jgi:hypothetical protein